MQDENMWQGLSVTGLACNVLWQYEHELLQPAASRGSLQSHSHGLPRCATLSTERFTMFQVRTTVKALKSVSPLC